MKLTRLEQLYRSLNELEENYYIFTFNKNGVNFDILFDIFIHPFELHFLQRDNNFSFKIIVKTGFIINTSIEKSIYNNLCDVLNLKYDKDNPFIPSSFFKEFNDKIPIYSTRQRKENELLDFYFSEIEDPDKLFFDGFIEWEKLKNGKKVSNKNLEKTRILYPNLYEKCKRENISIRYKAEN